jgi:SAM-dependent methyltransferase
LRRCLRCEAHYDGAVWRCPRCGSEPARVLGFPAFAPELSGTDAGFDPELFAELVRLEAGNFWFRARNRLLVRMLQRHFGAARNMLEIGCGTGFVLAGIADAIPGLRLCASEIHATALRHAAQRAPGAQLLQLDARRMPFADEFDVVGAFDVIEHIEDDAAVLREMHRAAVPGGGLLLTVPQHPFLWGEYDVRARHVRRYRACELRAKVEAAGFDVLRLTSFVSLLLPLLLVSRFLRRTGGASFDPLAELRLGPRRNALLEKVLDLERALLATGLRLPAGGSLLLVGRKPS